MVICVTLYRPFPFELIGIVDSPNYLPELSVLTGRTFVLFVFGKSVRSKCNMYMFWLVDYKFAFDKKCDLFVLYLIFF